MFGSMVSRQKKWLILLSLGAILTNAFIFENAIFGIFTLLIFLWSTGTHFGRLLLPGRTATQQLTLGAMGIIALLSLTGSALYYVAPVSQGALLVLICLIGLSVGLLGKNHPPEEATKTKQRRPSHITWIAWTGLLVSLTAWWSAILPHAITTSVRSPWDVVSPVALIALAVAIVFLFFLLKRREGITITLLLFVGVLFSSLALTTALYPLGYGFDPFIHRATVAHILEFGTITPKPFYYIGQYALEFFSVHVFSLPLFWVDTLLAPTLASTFLVASAGLAFSFTLKNRSLVALGSLFLLPLGAFISTTPQAISYVYTGVLLFLSLPVLLDQERAPSKWALALFAAAALITHPLAGIPAVIYLLLVLFATFKGPHPVFNKTSVGLIAIFGSLSLPAIFALQAHLADLSMQFSLASIFSPELVPFTFFLGNHYSSWFDALYLFIDNALWILLLLAACAIFFAQRAKASWKIHLPVIAAAVWFINFWLLSTTLQFEFLIEYERTNYAARLLILTMVFLIPHAGFALAGLEKTLQNKPRILFTSLLILFAVASTAMVYGAYPRHDNYARSAGFNVSQSDIDAVWAIHEAGGQDDYIVLANQAVSAAALETFGFARYYKKDIFYYPIPTGGELYASYLEMTDEAPSRFHALKAMDVAGVDKAFFVLNDYWWDADRIREHAKQEANAWFSIGQEEAVTIFLFER